jgi:hypothetical protein
MTASTDKRHHRKTGPHAGCDCAWCELKGATMTSEDNTIDVEVTHIEEHDDFEELDQSTFDAEMTSGIAIVTPEQYIERTPERRAARAEQMSKEAVIIPDRRPVLRVDPHGADHLEFAEDYSVLRVLYAKIFRRAINQGVELTDVPNVEEQVREIFGQDLIDAINDLDDARDGKTDLDWRRSEWKEALGI